MIDAEELIIKCPHCNCETSTGFWMDKESFESSTMQGNMATCQCCGKEITWNKKDVLNFRR